MGAILIMSSLVYLLIIGIWYLLSKLKEKFDEPT
jgi:hypothetical protein